MTCAADMFLSAKLTAGLTFWAHVDVAVAALRLFVLPGMNGWLEYGSLLFEKGRL